MVRGSKIQGYKPVQSKRGSGAVANNKQSAASPSVVCSKELKKQRLQFRLVAP